MNENINLTKILKDCPKGWKFWSPIFGQMEFFSISEICNYPIVLSCKKGKIWFSKEGLYDIENEDAECLLFPSKEQRDWNNFTAPWYKKDKFNPNTLQPFDKILIREHSSCVWKCNLFSYIIGTKKCYPCRCISGVYKYCIPYNDDTKHLINTAEEAPKYYRYWED